MLNEAEIRNEQYVQFRPRCTSFGFFQFHRTHTSPYPFRKKMHSRDVASSFLSFFFFSFILFALSLGKVSTRISEIGSIKRRRVILLDTVTCNSFFSFFNSRWNDSREFLSNSKFPRAIKLILIVTRWKVVSNKRYLLDTKFWNAK